MMKLLCSTGCLCTMRNGRDYRLIEKAARELKCDGLEFMMYGSWYDSWQKVAADIKGMGLNIPVMHVEKRVGEKITLGETDEARRVFRINCEMAALLGAEKLVLHLWDGKPSDGNFAANIDEYAHLRAIADEYGLILAVENVVCLYNDPLANLTALHDIYPDIAFTYDFKMAQFHDQVKKTFDEDHRWLWQGPVKHVHFSDIDADPMDWSKLRSLHPGEGRIDFAYVCQKLNEMNYSGHITIESTSVAEDGTIQTDKLNNSLARIREYLK